MKGFVTKVLLINLSCNLRQWRESWARILLGKEITLTVTTTIKTAKERGKHKKGLNSGREGWDRMNKKLTTMLLTIWLKPSLSRLSWMRILETIRFGSRLIRGKTSGRDCGAFSSMRASRSPWRGSTKSSKLLNNKTTLSSLWVPKTAALKVWLRASYHHRSTGKGASFGGWAEKPYMKMVLAARWSTWTKKGTWCWRTLFDSWTWRRAHSSETGTFIQYSRGWAGEQKGSPSSSC